MIDLKAAYGGNSGKPIGGLAWFKNPSVISALLQIGSTTYLRTGYVSKGESALYPDAYSLYSNPPAEKWITLPQFTLSTVSGKVQRIAFGNGIFVAVGNTGLLLTSNDGINWFQQPITSLGNQAWYSVCFGAGLFVAVGLSGAIKTSPDGVTWTARTNPIGTSYTMYDVTYGGGKFVAVATTGSSTNRAVYSTDGGITWTQALTNNFSSASAICQVTYGNGVFLIFGATTTILTSTDGLNWTTIGQTGATFNVAGPKRVVYGANGFYFTSTTLASGIMFSATGASGSWVSLTNQPQTAYQQYVYYANGVLFSWCYNTVSLTCDVYASKDNGTTWKLVTSYKNQFNATTVSLWADMVYGLSEYVSMDNSANNSQNAASQSVPLVSFDSAVGYPTIQTLNSDITRYMRIK